MVLPNYPNNPTLNEQFTVGTNIYQWDGEKWKALSNADNSLRTQLADVDSTVLVGGVEAGNLVKKSSSTVSILDFGAACDNSTDDSGAIQAAIDYAKNQGGLEVTAPAGKTCYIASSVDFKGLKCIDFLSNIRCDPSIVEVPVTIGGSHRASFLNINF